jgi:hypothetical protein
MKQLITILVLIPWATYGQSVKELQPTLGAVIEKSVEGEIAQLTAEEVCEAFWKDRTGHFDPEKLSEAEKRIHEICLVDFADYWSINGIGCSWYCGGGQDTLTASSELSPSKDAKYSASNAHDLSYKTAWIEGVDGHGIGEYLTYHIQPTNPRITEIIVVNGYVKSAQLWRDNSRVKKLKMYIDNKPCAILNLEDTKAEQHFKVEPIGNAPHDNWEELERMPVWTMRFEILSVYPGDKYQDTAITEIYFDGIDVH